MELQWVRNENVKQKNTLAGVEKAWKKEPKLNKAWWKNNKSWQKKKKEKKENQSLWACYGSSLDKDEKAETKATLLRLQCAPYPLFQLMICCGLQGGVGVAGRSLDGVRLLWLWGEAAEGRTDS